MPTRRGTRSRSVLLLAAATARILPLPAHDLPVADQPTFQISAPASNVPLPNLSLLVVDEDSGRPIPARFSLLLDGRPYVPRYLGAGGLRFTSIHQRKQQRQVITYARGTGGVDIPLPAGARRAVVRLAKGFEYLPREISVDIKASVTVVRVSLRRWTDLAEQGWLGCDEHLHYERPGPDHDVDWLTMMEADGLTHAHFMVLKGANIPGIWAGQFAYGRQGEGGDGRRWIRPGEEYRDTAQGHINLLGIRELIPPISTGGLGEPAVPFHFPPLHDVFLRARRLGGIAGVAHGAGDPDSHTAIVDTVLGALDFFEISNTHLFKTDVWYRLMNCGFVVPPAAGTDLPNFPYRDAWQPFLGEVRMYLRMGQERDFEAWKDSLHRGAVFVTSGPLIEFTANGVPPGGTVRLPPGGGEVLLKARLSSPHPLESLEIVHLGRPLKLTATASRQDSVRHLRIRRRLKVQRSGWLAARGTGVPKLALAAELGIDQKTRSHTAAIRVIVGGQPIRSASDAGVLIRQLSNQQRFYRTRGRYEKPGQREYVQKLFARAIAVLRKQNPEEQP